MKRFLIILIAVFSGSLMHAQQDWQQIIEQKMPDQLRMSCALWQVATFNETNTVAARQKATEMRLYSRDDGKYNVEIIYGRDVEQEIDENFVRSLNLEYHSKWKNRSSCWINTEDMLAVAQSLPEGYLMKAVLIQEEEDNQGPGQMNSDSYIAGGANGAGRRVAILDGGFNMLANAQNAGAAPAGYFGYDWTGNGLTSGTSVHGTACVETVFDHAPGATYYIHKIGNVTDMGNAVNSCIANGVDVISHSMSRYNLGWGDNSGAACSAVEDATDNGILFFTSAGNRNGTHYQTGSFSDSDGDDWHQFSGADEQNNFSVSDDGRVSAYLQWNANPDWFADDYDLYLYDASNNNVLASSTSGGDFESISWTNTSGSTKNVYLAVKQDGTDNNAFEIFNHDKWCTDFQYKSSSNSTTSPSNSTQSNCISVGAVAWNSYGSAAGTTGILASYSSRGPTNSGGQGPDVCGPTNTTTVAYGGSFGGTSCATPNAAGMATAFWSEHNYLSASGVRSVLFRMAKLYNDWGSGGTDNLYGRGGLEVVDWVNNSRFVYQGAGNIFGFSSLPYYSMQQAESIAPTNYTMLFLGEVMNAPPVGQTLMNKPMFYKSPINTTYILSN